MAAVNEASAATVLPPSTERPLAIEVRDVSKTYRIPTVKVSTLKERAVRLVSSTAHRELVALDGISFEVSQGEFFGIVGRNGSGKSTLLKLLASIYRADAGRIRIAGRLAPFIELGVGFNPELDARSNVTLNGVMMGLTPREARARFDAVLDFAELEGFADLKLKNYSSGMMVRLAFALMVQVDADVLLIDEVLAVGDAAFQLKCLDAFARLHEQGKTIVLVTHDTGVVSRHCDRALMIEAGKIDLEGSPDDVARRYLEVNYQHREQIRDVEDVHVAPDAPYTVEWLDAWLAGSDGEHARNLQQGEPIEIHVRFRANRDLAGPKFSLQVVNAEGTPVVVPDGIDIGEAPLTEGDAAHAVVRIDNRLAPGHYFVHTLVGSATEGRIVAFRKHALDFVVFGTRVVLGMVDLDAESTVSRDTDGTAPR